MVLWGGLRFAKTYLFRWHKHAEDVDEVGDVDHGASTHNVVGELARVLHKLVALSKGVLGGDVS